MKTWLILLFAIVSEVIATSALKSSAGFTRLWPSLIVVIGYASAFYCLSLTLEKMPIGIAYAVWSGVGVALIALVGWAFFGQQLNLASVIGIALIVSGVVTLNVFGVVHTTDETASAKTESLD